jgi:hypothetical protein
MFFAKCLILFKAKKSDHSKINNKIRAFKSKQKIMLLILFKLRGIKCQNAQVFKQKIKDQETLSDSIHR